MRREDELASTNAADVFGEDRNVLLGQQQARRLDVRGTDATNAVLEGVQHVGSAKQFRPETRPSGAEGLEEADQLLDGARCVARGPRVAIALTGQQEVIGAANLTSLLAEAHRYARSENGRDLAGTCRRMHFAWVEVHGHSAGHWQDTGS